MKATGIVRNVDDLGRIVLPKEIRRTMNIQERDALEIFLDKDFICLKKYDYCLSHIETLNQMKTNIDEIPDLKNKDEILKRLSYLLEVMDIAE